MKVFEELPDLPTTHNDLVSYIMKFPQVLGEDFKPIHSNFSINRGIIDVLGKKNGRLCIVEVKIDIRRSAISKAKQQLKSYARSINALLELLTLPSFDFCFIFVRLIEGHKLEVRPYENIHLLE